MRPSFSPLAPALALALVFSFALSPVMPSTAQAPAASLVPARDRVAFAPAMGGWKVFGRDYGLKAQNLGQHPTRFLLLAHAPHEGPPAATGCAECPRFTAVCSPVTDPGIVWPIFPGGGGAVVYSLSLRPVSEAGEAWIAFARSQGMDVTASLADVACRAISAAAGPFQGAAPTPTAVAGGGMGLMGPMGHMGPTGLTGPIGPLSPMGSTSPIKPLDSQEDPAGLDCALYRAFHSAYLGGAAMTELLPGLPLAALSGEPLAAAAAFEMPTIDEKGVATDAQAALDREAAFSLSETGLDREAVPADSPFVYVLPGVFLETPEFQKGLVWLQGASADCAEVTVEAFRGSQGQLPGKRQLSLAGGAVARFQPADSWVDMSAATLRVTSDRPLAVMASQLGYHTSASFNGSLVGPEPEAWAIPLAYQEPKPLPPVTLLAERRPPPDLPPLGGGASAGPPPAGGRPFTPPPSGGRAGGGRRSAAAPADGRRTQVAAFNTGPTWDNLQVDMQAEGQDPRGVPLGIAPLTQLLFEMGFGLGRAGGEGWARLSTATMPVVAAFYGYRLSTGEEAATETWAAPAWRYDPAGRTVGPRTIGLPAPAARHAFGEQQDADAPQGRIALQNLGGGRARLAVDSYDALCGFNGSRQLTLPPLEARLLAVDDLPGARWRDISVVVRVLEGEAAVQLEVARPHGFPITDFPADRAAALLGVPVPAALPPPVAREALLELTPPLISLPRPATRVSRTVTLRDSIRSGRCLSFEASSSAPWLTTDAAAGLLPADLTLTIDPARLPPGRQVAELTVRVLEDGVLGSPGKVTVVVEGAARAAVWLPWLGQGAGEGR